MRRPLTAALALALALAFTPPASAHSSRELDLWLQGWETRATAGVDAEVLAELEDMTARHAWYFDPQPPAVAPAAGSATAPGPAPAPVSGGNAEAWRGLVAAYFDPGDVDRAVCLIGFESKGDPNALNPTSGAAGLFQVMPFWWDHYGGDRFDPETNVRVAALILDEQGWTAWSPYKRGECR